MSEKQITPIQQDALKEAINIGAGNAANALSKIIDKNVMISVPVLYFCRVEEIEKNIDNLEKLMRVVLFQLNQDLSGTIMLLFPPEGVLELTEVLTKQRYKDINELPEFTNNAFLESSNIIVDACLKALSKFLGLNIKSSEPDMATDMVGSLFSEVLANLGLITEQIFEFKIDFNVEEKKIGGQIVFLFDPGATEKILKILNTKYKFNG